MPADFDKCVAEGGKVITVSHGETYIHVCYDKSGKSHSGEVKHKKGTSSSSSSHKGVGKKGINYGK